MDGSTILENVDEVDLDLPDDNAAECLAWRCGNVAMAGSAYCRDHKGELRQLECET